MYFVNFIILFNNTLNLTVLLTATVSIQPEASFIEKNLKEVLSCGQYFMSKNPVAVVKILSRVDSQLQQAICKGKSIRTILKIFNLDPIKVQYKNKLGDYPLHVALFCGNNNIAMKLVELFPETTHHQNTKGLYPLHVACRHHQLYCDRNKNKNWKP